MAPVYPTSVALEMDLANRASDGEYYGFGAFTKFAAISWTDLAADVVTKVKLNYGVSGYLPTERMAQPGRLTFALKNGENNSAGLLGYYSLGHANARANFKLGRATRLKIAYGGTPYYKFYGTLRKAVPVPGTRGQRHTLCEASDWLEDASQEKVGNIPVSTDLRSDVAFQQVVNSIAKQPPRVSYAVGRETFPIFGDDLRAERSTIYSALVRIIQSEGGYGYMIGDTTGGGTLRFEDRHYRVKNTTVSLSLAEAENFELDTDASDDDIFNIVEAPVNLRELGTVPEVLYSLTGTIEIQPGQTVTVRGRFVDPSNQDTRLGGTAMIPPVAMTDYRFSSSPTGDSGDMTSYLSVQAIFDGNEVEWRLRNLAGSAGIVTRLRVMGTAVRTYEPLTVEEQDGISVRDHGPRRLTLSLPYITAPLKAKDRVLRALKDWKDPKLVVKSVTFVANRSDALMTAALATEPGARIRLTESVSALANRDYFVNGVDLNISDRLRILCKWFLSPADTAVPWLLGNTTYGKLQTATALGT